MRHSGPMTSYRNALGIMLVLAVVSAAALSQSPPAAPPGPLTVTTDTAEYCNSLAGRVAAEQRNRPAAQPEAQRLADEGQRMCDAGLIRGGLTRLRRALLLLESAK
jgi:hypothetical protein